MFLGSKYLASDFRQYNFKGMSLYISSHFTCGPTTKANKYVENFAVSLKEIDFLDLLITSEFTVEL